MQRDLSAELSDAAEAEEAARRAWSAELDRIEALPLTIGDLKALGRALADPGYQAKWRAYTEAAQRRHAVMDRMKAAEASAADRPFDPARSRVSHEIGHA